MISWVAIWGLGLFSFIQALANNVKIQSLAVRQGNELSLLLSWENSWNNTDFAISHRLPPNHDAVWLFFKYRWPSENFFRHLLLDTSQKNYWHSPTVFVKSAPSGTGLLIIPAVGFQGNHNNIEIAFALPAFLKDTVFELEAHAIEMVYVNEGPFYVGDGISQNSLSDYQKKPFEVVAEKVEIPVGNRAGALSGIADWVPTQPIPVSFPKGFAPFYVMKYEISQAQYVAFLNSLSPKQQRARVAEPITQVGNFAFSSSASTRFRNGIRVIKAAEGDMPAVWGCDDNQNLIPNEANDGCNRACNFLNWADLVAYLDWAGLRPMTELEFEKACRGPKYPVAREFAFGTPYVRAARFLLDDGTEEERATELADDSTGIASHGYLSPQGPLRAGFAAPPGNTSRLQAGASYYGIFELSGNVWELCVTFTPQGLLFEGNLGDGQLDENGNANEKNWFPEGSNATYRGGAWNSGISLTFRDLAVSDRFYGGLRPTLRRNTSGGRGVLAW